MRHRTGPYLPTLIPASTDDAWRDSAACVGYPSEVFFPWDSASNRVRHPGLAEDICNQCQVKAECEEYARRLQPSDGIWAGLSPRQLKR